MELFDVAKHHNYLGCIFCAHFFIEGREFVSSLRVSFVNSIAMYSYNELFVISSKKKRKTNKYCIKIKTLNQKKKNPLKLP